jgi:hypothetical protein
MFCICTYPYIYVGLCNGISAHLITNVEITISHGAKVFVDLYPIMVHAKGTKNDVAVVPTEIVENVTMRPWTHLEENGIYELHDVIAAHIGQSFDETHEECHMPQRSKAMADVDVTWIVLPTVAATDYGNLVPQRAQGLC